jgi:uncharacterized protein YpmS
LYCIIPDPRFHCLDLLTLFPTNKTFDLLKLKDKFHSITNADATYFSRSLKFNYHINSYVKENADQKLNYCIRIHDEHGNFNRLSFGDALWHSAYYEY